MHQDSITTKYGGLSFPTGGKLHWEKQVIENLSVLELNKESAGDLRNFQETDIQEQKLIP